MVKGRISRISGLIFICLIIWLILGFDLVLPNYQNTFNRTHEGHIGFLDPKNPDISKGFKRCSNKLPVGFYHSSAPYIYKGGKPSFRKYIQTNFSKNSFTDSGYLNFRFLINCKGEIGDVETNQLNTNLKLTELNVDLVNELSRLTLREANWNALETRQVRDIYMYIIYKIENGQIVEILP